MCQQSSDPFLCGVGHRSGLFSTPSLGSQVSVCDKLALKLCFKRVSGGVSLTSSSDSTFVRKIVGLILFLIWLPSRLRRCRIAWKGQRFSGAFVAGLPWVQREDRRSSIKRIKDQEMFWQRFIIFIWMGARSIRYVCLVDILE